MKKMLVAGVLCPVATLRRFLISMLTALLLAVMATPASAITNPRPDNGEHPYVGLVLVYADGQFLGRCSGTLLSPTVFLTAGHCTVGADSARVFFDENVDANPEYPGSGATSYEGTPYTYPDFCSPCGNGLRGFMQGDVGIIVLSEPVPTSVVNTYGQLPERYLVDRLARNANVDLVGYGLQDKERLGRKPDRASLRMRFQADARLVPGSFVISDQFIRVTANPGQDKGGTCSGDSGGPVLTDERSTVLAVTSFGNSSCTGVNYYQRIDTPEILAWIESFLNRAENAFKFRKPPRTE